MPEPATLPFDAVVRTGCKLCEARAKRPDFPEHCGRCDTHHPATSHCSMVGTIAHACPRCRRNKCAVVHVMEAFNPDRKKYGTYCHDCYVAMGFALTRYRFSDGAGNEWELIGYELKGEPDGQRAYDSDA